MDIFLFFFMLFMLSLILVGIPFSVSYWIYRFIKRKHYDPKYRFIALAPLLLTGYLVFDAIYPSEDFYRDDFKEITGIEPNTTAYFLHKDTSYPDIHGDYTSVAIVEVGSYFYEKLSQHLKEEGFIEDYGRMGGSQMTLAYKRLEGKKINREFSKNDSDRFYYVAFYLINKLYWCNAQVGRRFSADFDSVLKLAEEMRVTKSLELNSNNPVI